MVRNSRRTFLKGIGSITAAGFAGLASAGGASRRAEFLVGTSAGYGPDGAEAEIQATSAVPTSASVLDRDESLNYLAIEVPSGSRRGLESATEAIRTRPSVRYVEPNGYSYMAKTRPDDGRFSEQYAPQRVRAPEAWDETFGSRDVTVAVIDQGVMYDHPDLGSQFASQKGRNFKQGGNDPYPKNLRDEYHGTHVAGIASASTDNGRGVAGISDSTLLSARVFDAEGRTTWNQLAKAIRWSTDQGADVINMSLSGRRSETIANAVSYARSNGTLPVAAAGNYGKSQVYFPAAFPECVSVGAIDRNNALPDWTCYGEKLDVLAPGKNVLSTWTWERQPYKPLSGTSMATPVVAGVAALAKAADPSLTPDQLHARIRDTAYDLGKSDQRQGYGLVDAAKVVAGEDGNGGQCGTETIDRRRRGSLSDGSDAEVVYYLTETDDPCSLEVTLDGPDDADFDLYATADARTPTPRDHDYASKTPDSNEFVRLDSLSGEWAAFRVHGVSGSGSWDLWFTEFGA